MLNFETFYNTLFAYGMHAVYSRLKGQMTDVDKYRSFLKVSVVSPLYVLIIWTFLDQKNC